MTTQGLAGSVMALLIIAGGASAWLLFGWVAGATYLALWAMTLLIASDEPEGWA